jgi:hypothetical protein
MKRSRTPSFTNPFLVWSRLAWKTSEMMLASAHVIQHRTGRVAEAGATPDGLTAAAAVTVCNQIAGTRMVA